MDGLGKQLKLVTPATSLLQEICCSCLTRNERALRRGLLSQMRMAKSIPVNPGIITSATLQSKARPWS
jgi:hypothetical protein